MFLLDAKQSNTSIPYGRKIVKILQRNPKKGNLKEMIQVMKRDPSNLIRLKGAALIIYHLKDYLIRGYPKRVKKAIYYKYV